MRPMGLFTQELPPFSVKNPYLALYLTYPVGLYQIVVKLADNEKGYKISYELA